MRVLVVSTDYPPHRCGGYELHCRMAVEHLRASGHEVHVLTSAREGGTADRDPFVRRELVRFPVAPSALSVRDAWRGELRTGSAVERALREIEPDVVSLWRLGELSMSILERVRTARVPMAGMVCDPWMVEGPRRDPWSALRGHRPRLDDVRWLFVSDALLSAVALEVELGDDVAVAHAGVELSRLPLAAPKSWSGSLLYAGRLSGLKGVDTAIRATARLPGARLRVVGEGDAAPFRALADELGCAERVEFTGPCPPRRMAGAYARADVVLFPSRWEEPFGLVPLEAMACGTPVVASGTGGSAEYLRDGANALVVGAEDDAGWATAITRLAGDAALRGRLRDGGRATAEQFPAARNAEAVRVALEDVASREPAAASLG